MYNTFSVAASVAPIVLWHGHSPGSGNVYLSAKNTFLEFYTDEKKAIKRSAAARSSSCESRFTGGRSSTTYAPTTRSPSPSNRSMESSDEPASQFNYFQCHDAMYDTSYYSSHGDDGVHDTGNHNNYGGYHMGDAYNNQMPSMMSEGTMLCINEQQLPWAPSYQTAPTPMMLQGPAAAQGQMLMPGQDPALAGPAPMVFLGQGPAQAAAPPPPPPSAPAPVFPVSCAQQEQEGMGMRGMAVERAVASTNVTQVAPHVVKPRGKPEQPVAKKQSSGELNLEPTDEITTLMIRGIPCSFSQDALMRTIDNAGFKGKYDFFYLPRAGSNGTNLGYAFINFVDATVADQCMTTFNGSPLDESRSSKVCTIAHADIQGLANLRQHFRKTAVSRGSRGPVFLKVFTGQESPQ